ncbi:MAG: Asp-tRNA(Asn)/Glu-tRNA(Gln) amidotransferase GatCAB subunit A [Candidatus Hydrogenedentota bacterium]|nr:MAG: Asp-tRNA(Asn)/Glu-tRNA(Gln) amidotransferase GatCAB subunit A [Candidatus Hydrogenedentota bacterium]
MSDTHYTKTAHELGDDLRSGAVTATSLMESQLARIDDVDGKTQAYVEVWKNEALERAGVIDNELKQGNDPGPLAGIPIGLKDNLCTTIGTTTCASQILKGFESPYDATVVTKMKDAGGIFTGKLNMDEFAMGSSTENSSIQKTCNPWDLGRVPGGSSGGAAASVAAHEAVISIGSDTGGSIRQPAAFCGCVGLKPTYGRVSRFGVVAFASSLDQIGPFTKDVEDCALMMNVLSGQDPYDATSADIEVPDYRESLKQGVDGLTVGLPKEFYTDSLNDEMRGLIDKAVDVLKGQGANVVEVSLPHSDYGIAVYYIIATAEASANLARFDGVRYGFRHPDAKNVDEMYRMSKSEGYGQEVQRRIMLGTYVLSSGYYDAYYLKAQKVRALIRQDFDKAFEQCDVIVTPTTPTAAFEFGAKVDDPMEMYLNDIYTSTANLAGVPGISIPCGLTENKLPAGLQIIGKPFAEADLFRTAYAYEQNRGFDMGDAPVA